MYLIFYYTAPLHIQGGVNFTRKKGKIIITVPEAMMFGLPVVSTKTFVKSEIIDDGKSGFLIRLPKKWKGYRDMNERLLSDLMHKTSLLIENDHLRREMSRYARKSAIRKFSIERRNNILGQVYEEALQKNQQKDF